MTRKMKVSLMRDTVSAFKRNVAESLRAVFCSAVRLLSRLHVQSISGAYLILLAGLLATVLIAAYTMAGVRESTQRELEFSGKEIRLNIASRLAVCGQILHSGAALFDASNSVERGEWKTFVQSLRLDQQLPGIQGVGFAQLIAPEQRDQHVREIRDQGFPDYQILPPGERETYTSIVYIEPFRDRNLRAFGYDMLSEPVRRRAMERARDENAVALTGKVTLVQETGHDVQAGTLMYLPVYRHGQPMDSVAQRRASILGWVYSPYRMIDLIKGTLGDWEARYADRPIYLQVFDGEKLSKDSLLYSSWPATDGGANVAFDLTYLDSIEVAGCRWTLHFAQAGVPVFSSANSIVWLIVLGGLAVTALLFLLAVALLNTRSNARTMAHELTLELRDSEEKYRTVADFTYDWEAWRGPDGAFKYVSPSCERITGHRALRFLEEPSLLLNITHPDDRPMLASHYDMTLREDCREDFNFDFRIFDVCGELHWISHSCVAIHGEDGHYLGRRESFRDISERKMAEASLQVEYSRLEGVIEGTRAGTWEWNVQTGETVFNEVWAEMLGYTLEELAPVSVKTWETLAYPDDFSQSAALLERHFAGELPFYDLECRMKHKEGHWIWVHDRGRLITRTSDGEPLLMFGTHIDITDRKRSAALLKESEESYRNQFAMNSSVMLLIDRSTGSIVDANAAAVKFYGYPRERLLEMKIQEINILAEAEVREAMGTVMKEKGKLFSFKHRLADGSTRHVDVSSSSVRFGERELLHSIVQDVTARKEAEQSLDKARIHYQSLLDTASDGIHVIDRDGNIVDASASFYRMLGYPPRDPELRNVADWDVQWTADELGERILEFMARPTVFETQHRCRDGNVIDVEINARGISIDGTTCLYASSRDITERKIAEQEQKALQKQLAQSQKMESVGQLAGGVAHDFNNMLGVICGHADLAIGQVEADSMLYFSLTEIRTAARRSADLTQQLLAFARKQVIMPRAMDLNMVISDISNKLGRLTGEGIRLDLKPGIDLWMVETDPAQIEQILISLCVNATEAMKGTGIITIETGNTTLDEEDCQGHLGAVPGDYVLLSVRDNGCGMNQATLLQLFEPFFTTKGFGEGAGLGLATVYGAVKQNKGYITVASEPGKGATFSIFLPRIAAVASPAEPETNRGEPARGGETLLLVEDEPTLLNLTTQLLERQGYRVLPASSPAQALKWILECGDQIQLLITDVVMPEMNGRELAREILAGYPDMKCLFMSGYTADIIADDGVLEAGFSFIQKPFSMASISAKVREVLGEPRV